MHARPEGLIVFQGTPCLTSALGLSVIRRRIHLFPAVYDLLKPRIAPKTVALPGSQTGFLEGGEPWFCFSIDVVAFAASECCSKLSSWRPSMRPSVVGTRTVLQVGRGQLLPPNQARQCLQCSYSFVFHFTHRTSTHQQVPSE